MGVEKDIRMNEFTHCRHFGALLYSLLCYGACESCPNSASAPKWFSTQVPVVKLEPGTVLQKPQYPKTNHPLL
jgi:hypothetical protein